jgi:hypothetical protein
MGQATRQETREAQMGLLAEHKVLKNKTLETDRAGVGRDYCRENEEKRALCYK